MFSEAYCSNNCCKFSLFVVCLQVRMTSGGSSVTYLRLLSQLRDYVARATPTSLVFQKDLPDLVKKISNSIYTSKEIIEDPKIENAENKPPKVVERKPVG